MKNLVIIFMLLIANFAFAGNGAIKFESKYDAPKAYQRINNELRELGFELVQFREGKYFIAERTISGKQYQVYVKLKRKKILVDVYAFVTEPYSKKYSDWDNFGVDVSDDIFTAIKYRMETGTSIPDISLPSLWGTVRRDIEE
jgi:hypothetical protein